MKKKSKKRILKKSKKRIFKKSKKRIFKKSKYNIRGGRDRYALPTKKKLLNEQILVVEALAQARNTKLRSEINAILKNSVKELSPEHKKL